MVGTGRGESALGIGHWTDKGRREDTLLSTRTPPSRHSALIRWSTVQFPLASRLAFFPLSPPSYSVLAPALFAPPAPALALLHSPPSPLTFPFSLPPLRFFCYHYYSHYSFVNSSPTLLGQQPRRRRSSIQSISSHLQRARSLVPFFKEAALSVSPKYRVTSHVRCEIHSPPCSPYHWLLVTFLPCRILHLDHSTALICLGILVALIWQILLCCADHFPPMLHCRTFAAASEEHIC
jgi:hypothetical protein